MAGTRTKARDVPRVLVTAGRLLLRHWPALLSLAFLGAALRAGALWAAVEVSDHVPILGQLLLVLAPLGYLLPIIAMLHICRDSLPNLSRLEESHAPEALTEGRERRLVDVAVSVLVPFLAVYVSYGLLDDDLARFRNVAAYDEFNRIDFTRTITYNFADRLGIYPLQIAVLIVVVAWVLRWALGRIENITRFLLLAFVGALVEVHYTSQVAGQSLVLKTAGTEWLDQRRAIAAITDMYHGLIGGLGPLGHPVDAFTTGLLGLIGSLDAVVVVPVAWLTVGAVVLGHKLTPPAPLKHPVLDRFQRLPKGLRRQFGSLLSDIRERWSAFWNGLRLLAGAGLVPMLVFGVTFLVVIRIPTLVSELVRWIVGPVDSTTFLAFSPMEDAVGLALSMAVTAPMLAAALDWMIAPRLGTTQPGAPAPTAGPEVARSREGRTTPAHR